MGRSLLKTPVKSGLPGVYPVFRSRSSHLPQPGYDIMPTVSPFRLGHKTFDLGRMPDGIISPQHLLTNWQAKSRDFSSKALQNPGSGVILVSRCGSCGAFRFHEDARTGVAGGSPRCSNAVGPQRQLAPSSGIQREVRRKSDLFSFLGCPGVSSSGPARRRRVHAPPPPPTPPGRKKSRNNSQEDRSRSRSCRGLKEKRRVHQEELRIASRAAKCCGTPACRPIRRNVRSRRRCRESPASHLRLCRLIPIGNSKSVNLGAAFVRSQTFAAFVPFPLEAGFPTDLK